MDPMTLMALMSSVSGMAGGGGGGRPPMPMMQPSPPSPVVQPPATPHIGGAAQGGGDPNEIFTHQIAQLGQMPPAQAMQLAQMNLAAAQSAGHQPQMQQWQGVIQRMHQAQVAQQQQRQDMQTQVPKPPQPQVAQPPAGLAGARPMMGPVPQGVNPGAMIRGTLGGGY